ncbi:MAG: radical SAM family heme chaperone HemW [Acidobacteriota bacterium]|nr:radical SAM family heme chaperone HemW [Acidobacteriota bacterium]
MKTAGIYIHIPFCLSRCSYCDFATGMYSATLAERYVLSVAKEISNWSLIGKAETIDTIYFGGGTPSLLSPFQLKTLLEAVRGRFEVSSGAEVTMEMNPGTVTPETLIEFRKLGVNRASFGAQTFNDLELARLGRSHTSDDTRRTFRYLRDCGFDNASFDLIAALPGQTMAGWKRNLDEAFSLRPEHLSFYLLEVHKGTPLEKHISQGIQPRPDEDLAAEMYEVMLDRACESGYQHYEISNLCLPGYESRHNTKYWTAAPYYGFGCSAHSYDGGFRRWANESDLIGYMAMIEQDKTPVVTRTELTQEDRQAEAVFLGLRMMEGLSMSGYQQLFGADLRKKHESDLTRFREAGLIAYAGDRVRLTRAGALLSNEVFSAFV